MYTYTEDILVNNYNYSDNSNKNQADYFVRIPVSSILNRNLIRVPDFERNVWVSLSSQPINLVSVKAEIICPQCMFEKRSQFCCTKCDGQGTIFDPCERCDGSGTYGYRKCWNCDGDGEGDDSDTECDRCNGTGNYNWRRAKKCWGCRGNKGDNIDCDQCGTSGKVHCSSCKGKGAIKLPTV